MEDLTDEEKQQLLQVQGAADVVRRETLNLFGVGFTEEEKRDLALDHVMGDVAEQIQDQEFRWGEEREEVV